MFHINFESTGFSIRGNPNSTLVNYTFYLHFSVQIAFIIELNFN